MHVSDDPLAALTRLDGVASAMAAARDGIDVALRQRGLVPAGDATAESLLRGAHASAVLAGSETSLETLRRGGGDPLGRAAVRVSIELLGLSGTFSRAPLQVFARLHMLAAKGSTPDDELGRPRDREAAVRLRTLADTLQRSTSAPALVPAAIAHAEVATVRPFGSADGIVARALERLLLSCRGVDTRSLTVPEAGHLELCATYESALDRYRRGGTEGMRAWLLYAAEAFAAGARAAPVGP